jgi:membrane-associated phospholipid phosphatase
VESLTMFVREKAWWLLAAHGLLAALLYGIAAHHPISEPLIVHPSAIDHWIPFVPAAAWLYATYLGLLPALLLARRTPGFTTVFVAGTLCAILNAIVYILFPTALAARSPAPPGTLLALVQALDTTLCALPSGHVALPSALTASAWVAASDHAGHRRWWRSVAAGFAVWTVVLAASTLLTRQHYLIDALAGAVFGVAVAGAVCIALRPATKLAETLSVAGIRRRVVELQVWNERGSSTAPVRVDDRADPDPVS